MSITCDACGLSYAGGRGLRGILAQPSRLADPRFAADARRGAAVPPRRPRTCSTTAPTTRTSTTPARQTHVGRVPGRRRLLRVLRPALRAAPGLLRLVLGRLRLRGLPRPPPVPVPRPPRDAHRARLPHLAHGRRRLGDVRRCDWPSGSPHSGADVRHDSPVTAVTRHDDGVDVRTAADAVATYDRVVVATHADQALHLLDDANATGEGRPRCDHLLGQRDLAAPRPERPPRHAPQPAPRGTTGCAATGLGGDEPVLVSYWMNRLRDSTTPTTTSSPSTPPAASTRNASRRG